VPVIDEGIHLLSALVQPGGVTATSPLSKSPYNVDPSVLASHANLQK
jgi:hypothetical protein